MRLSKQVRCPISYRRCFEATLRLLLQTSLGPGYSRLPHVATPANFRPSGPTPRLQANSTAQQMSYSGISKVQVPNPAAMNNTASLHLFATCYHTMRLSHGQVSRGISRHAGPLHVQQNSRKPPSAEYAECCCTGLPHVATRIFRLSGPAANTTKP